MVPRQRLHTANRRLIASAILLLFVIATSWPSRPTAAEKESLSSNQANLKVETTTADGLITADFFTPRGRITVYLPDDMAAGDTISGSVRAEPAGLTPEERQRNFEELVREFAKQGLEFAKVEEGNLATTFRVQLNETATELALGDIKIPVLPQPIVLPSTSSGFLLPNLGQAGRPIQIGGSFDGDLANTSCTVGGKPTQKLAESPRKAVFESPHDVIGQSQITVREQGNQSQSTFRNVGVRLTAPKTALTKGESTTVTVEVSGLDGLEQNVAMDLNCSGAANMAGGNQQNVQIKPGDVKTNGTVMQTRQITGQQPGGFAVNANIKANNQPCSLTGQLVHIESEPYGGDQGVWKVKIKLQNGKETEIVIQSDQKPALKFCNWIQIMSCKDGVVPPEDRHGYELTKEPKPTPPDPKSAGTKPTPSPDPKPSPKPTDLPKSPSVCKEGSTILQKRDQSEPINIVDENSGFKLEISVITDTKGRQEARDLATWFRGISTVGGFLQGLLPKGAPDIGMGANIASLIFAELDAGADILDAASRARLTNMDPTKFKINFEVKTKKITPYCDTYLVCRNGVWVTEKRYGQHEANSKVTITKTIEATSGDWNLVSTSERFDPEKADNYARGLVQGVFAGLSTNKTTLATVQQGCK